MGTNPHSIYFVNIYTEYLTNPETWFSPGSVPFEGPLLTICELGGAFMVVPPFSFLVTSSSSWKFFAWNSPGAASGGSTY